MAAETTNRIMEGKEYRQHILDKLQIETSEAESFLPENNNDNDKDKYVRALEVKIDNLKSIIDDMTERSRHMESEAKAEFEKDKSMLEKRYKDAKLRLGELRQTSGDAWKELQGGAVRAWDELAESVKAAINRIR